MPRFGQLQAAQITRTLARALRLNEDLAEAIGLVILVMFLFLQNWRSTIIPAVTIPVSLVGTFAFVKVFGFSINTLTMFAMVLAIGMLVDEIGRAHV